MNSAAPARDTILYLIGSLEIGGAERHLAQIAPRLSELGWKPIIYCLSHRGPLARNLEQAGIEVIGPPWEWLRYKEFPLKATLYLVQTCIALTKLMITRRPKIVHCLLPAPYVIGCPLAMLTRIPIRIMSRRNLNRYQDKRPVVRRFEHWLHKHTTALLGNSRAVVRELIELENCDPDRVHLIHNGVDMNRNGNGHDRTAIRNELGIADDVLLMIIVANLIHYKGHADLFQALARKRETINRPWFLYCVGRDDGELQKLQHLARTYDVAQNVRFLGLRTDVPDLLRAADLCLLASHEEGFSNAILEAMASGLPLVVTDVGGNAEAVVNGETGLVVPPRDIEAMAQAIGTLTADMDTARAMGAAGRKRVQETFSLDLCVDKYDTLYRDLQQQA